MTSATRPARLRKTMRRVRLEKLCETKNCQAERASRRMVSKRWRVGRGTSSPCRSAFCAKISAVRSSTSFKSSSVDRGDFPASRDAPLVHLVNRIINDGSRFLEAIADAVERLDHLEVVVDHLEFPAQPLDGP